MWDDLTTTAWGNAALTTAVFLLWCAAGLVLVNMARRRINAVSLHRRWRGFEVMQERLRWSVPMWIVLSGAFVALAIARLFQGHDALAALAKAALAVFVVSVGAVIIEATYRLLGHELRSSRTPEPLVRFAQTLAAMATSFITALVLLAVVDVELTPLFALGGLLLAPIFLVFQDVLANVMMYYRLSRRGHLRVGDFVRLENGVAGHVMEITWQGVRIRTRANNLVAVPNRRLWHMMVTTYHQTEQATLCSTPVRITGEADGAFVEQALLEELRGAASELAGIAEDEPFYVSPDPKSEKDGYGFLLFYHVIDSGEREALEEKILQRVAHRLYQEGMESPLTDMLRSQDVRREVGGSARDLHALAKGRFSETLFIVASNREPYIHNFEGRSIRWSRPVSGMASALDPVMSVLGGVWVAHGGGSADWEVTDRDGRVRVPPDRGDYTLRRLALSKEQEASYYYGFSNQVLWPLCHAVYVKPRFDAQFWQGYQEVNKLFAEAIAEEARGRRAFVFLQDFHLALVPRLLREARVPATIAHFWHIPWPSSEVFRACPWAEELLDGLLGNDLMGFHVRQFCNNFLRSVDETLESRVDYDRSTIVRQGRQTVVRSFPIGVDFEQISQGVDSAPVLRQRAQFQRNLALDGCRIGLGVDRLDYTKGIPERLRAIDRFFTKYPDRIGKFTFVQVGVPSRSQIQEYKAVTDEVEHLVDYVNWRHQRGSWRPVVYLRRQFDTRALWSLYGMADVCVVSSLHDGMNLIAKEYIASRTDNSGVLLLSKSTGAATELGDALLINPYDTEGFADALNRALEMDSAEQSRRMQRLRTQVQEHDVYRWASRLLSEISRVETADEQTVTGAREFIAEEGDGRRKARRTLATPQETSRGR